MKKLFCIVMALVLLFALSACGDKPSDPSNPSEPSAPVGGGSSAGSPTDIEIPEATPTPAPQPVMELSVCGIPVVMGGQLSGIGYQGTTYNEGVLTIENVDLVPEQGNYPIYFVGDLEIVIKGENKITANPGSEIGAAIYAADGATVDGAATASNLILSGDGNLTIAANVGTNEADGIWCTGKVTVTATGIIDVTASTHAVHEDAQLVTDGLVVTEQTATRLRIGG